MVNDKYIICPDGTIIGYYGRRLKPRNNGHGYLRVHIYTAGVPKDAYIHRLVAEKFVPNPRNLPEVNHKDKNKANNHFSNLEWCTRRYNAQHAGKLDKAQVQVIRECCAAGYPMRAIGKYFNISCGHVSDIKHNNIWL